MFGKFEEKRKSHPELHAVAAVIPAVGHANLREKKIDKECMCHQKISSWKYNVILAAAAAQVDWNASARYTPQPYPAGQVTSELAVGQ